MAPRDWDPTEFQAAVTAWLDRTGMHEREAALMAGVSQSVFNRWRRDRGDDYLVQPTPRSLALLAPKIGIPHAELMRMAGHVTGVADARPATLVDLLRHVEKGYYATEDDELRRFRAETTRSIWPEERHQRRPNRRMRKSDEGLDHSKMDYLMHNSPRISRSYLSVSPPPRDPAHTMYA